MMKETFKHLLLSFTLSCLFLNSTNALFSMPSPWGYRCDSEKGICIKEEKTGVNSYISLARCKLTCSPNGILWPKPSSIEFTDKTVSHFLPSKINLDNSAPSDDIKLMLEEAFSIFKDNLEKTNPSYSDELTSWEGTYDPAATAHTLKISITVSESDNRLTLDTSESYSLAVSTASEVSTAVIIADTYFGARHALETLSQLIEYEEETNTLMLVNGVGINDSPVFPYRGLSIDTSRNFLSVKSIERILDGMAANKLNTFHWHVTDSHSFPIYLENLPKMTYYGAYSSSMIYFPANVKHIVEYGRIRGIRVLPEFDAPAHVGNGFQWGPQHGLGDLAVCVNQEPWESYCVEPPCGQLNIANENMYGVLGQIYIDFINLFGPLDMFHYGGDEINLGCWNATKEITDWMTEKGHDLSEDNYYQEWSNFQSRAYNLFTEANSGVKIPGVIWTSHLTEEGRADTYLSRDDYIIQIWTQFNDSVIGELLDKNYRVIFSNYDHWYFDCGFGAWVGEGHNWCSPYKGWQTVYDNNPIAIASSLTETFDSKLILGGEAAMWSEQVDDAAIDSRLWPRGAALGERLWSNPEHNWEPAEIRLVHQRQRMVQRGIQADRVQPQWCHQNEGLCYITPKENEDI